MKKPCAVAEGCEPGSIAPTAEPREDCRWQILIRPFTDHRHCETGPLHLARSASFATVFPESAENLALCSKVVTDLFARALKRAGYDVVMESAKADLTRGAEGGRIVFEGELWSFHFETQATPILEVDLSLLLRAGDSCEVLWQCDFPVDDTIPIWIGLGCEPTDMVQEGLMQAEESVLRQVAAPEFAMAVRKRASSSPEPASDHSDHSHEIVPSPSWTATDSGEIKAAAHESDAVVANDKIPTADLYENAFSGPPKQRRAPAGATAGGKPKPGETVLQK